MGRSSFLKAPITSLLCVPSELTSRLLRSLGQQLEPAIKQHPLRLHYPSKPNLLPPTYADTLVGFPACSLTFVASPWPPPGPWSTCLRAPPPTPHYHMNAGREDPAEAWTPTEGNGFAIHFSSTSSHTLYTETRTVTSMIESGERDRCAFTRSCHACARICVYVCASEKRKDEIASGDY